MKPAEQRLLDSLANGESPALVLATDTKVDVGQWLRRGRVSVACFAGRVVVFAAGRRPYAEEFPVAQLTGSFYNFLTGELVLAKNCRLKLAPLDAHKVLEQLKGKEVSHA